MGSATSAALATISLDQLLRECDALREAGQAQVAIERYQQWLAVSVNPHKPLALFNLGALLQSTGDCAGAAEVYQQCLVLRPQFAEVSINLGLVFERLGQTAQALAQWERRTL